MGLVSVVAKTTDDGQHNIQIFLRREIDSQNACLHTVQSYLIPETHRVHPALKRQNSSGC